MNYSIHYTKHNMPPRLRAIVPINSTLLSSQSCSAVARTAGQTVRQLSSTASLQGRKKARPPTRQRRYMYGWLYSRGLAFRDPLPGSTNYLSAYNRSGQLIRVANAQNEDGAAKTATSASGEDAAIGTDDGTSVTIPPETLSDLRPFPLNRDFLSQPVASESLREVIWSKIMREGLSVSTVSAELGVTMERVGAIVRMKEVEKQWIRKGKPLASQYARAVMSMLPQTSYPPGKQEKAHESINDLPVHAATRAQIFHPTSESRHFTRADAAAVFLEGLKPADERVPHPELALLEKDRLSGISQQERIERAKTRSEQEERLTASREERRKKREEASLTVVDKGRWEFRFKDISVEAAGKDGRGPDGVGWRYGHPHEDRKRGQVKIPTRVA